MWDMIVGLETHVELSTATKIFCACTTAFGGKPNTHCCPVCTGQPGSLPVLNESVVHYAVRAGIALGCKINNWSVMSRKHYVYPDLPKAYQISQFDKPICEGGGVTLTNGRRIGLTRIHIEEDAGKLVHVDDAVLIDYNRGGVPLIEIVSEPDFRSAGEAVEYLRWLQMILRAIGVSDCRMQEGSMRCDVNISIRRAGDSEFGTRTEIKNLNSFTSVSAAIDYEYKRQMKVMESGGEIVQETRSYNAETGETSARRDKENADDYRYCPEPDIPPVYISEDAVDLLRSTMPETPDVKFKRYVDELNISESDAEQLCKYKAVSDYFETAAEGVSDPTIIAVLIVTQMFAVITTEVEREGWSPKTSAEQLRELALLFEEGRLNRNLTKRILSKMLKTGKSCGEYITAADLEEMSEETLEALCRETIEQEEKTVTDYRKGKEKAIKALVGGVMKKSKGRADAVRAEALLRSLITRSGGL